MKQKHGLTYTVIATLVTAVLGMTMTTTHAKQYYKWVDSKGSTHYTTTPPPKSARSKAKVETYGWGGNSTSAKPAPVQQPAVAQPSAPTNTAPVPVNNGQNQAPVANQQKETNTTLPMTQNAPANAEQTRLLN